MGYLRSRKNCTKLSLQKISVRLHYGNSFEMHIYVNIIDRDVYVNVMNIDIHVYVYEYISEIQMFV